MARNLADSRLQLLARVVVSDSVGAIFLLAATERPLEIVRNDGTI